MRLWHQSLISQLPRQQLLGQHRECCALRGNGWGKSHSTVNYVFNYGRDKLVAYHLLVMKEMLNRGYTVANDWWVPHYCGKSHEPIKVYMNLYQEIIYSEHDDCYLIECINNLENKGIIISLS